MKSKSLTRGKPVKTFDSLAQAAAAMGLPIALLRKAKAAGCPAFRGGGRVHRAELEKWLGTHAGEMGQVSEKERLTLEILTEKARDLKCHNDQRAHLLVMKADVIGAIQRGGGRWNTARLRIEAEQPAKLVGINSIPEMSGKVKGLMDEVTAVLNALASEFETL